MSKQAMSSPADDALARVTERALTLVEPGMRLGLGTGRAAEAFIRALGQRVREGLTVAGVPTSQRSELAAREAGVPLIDLADLDGPLDLAVDGADEVAPDLGLTKGLGGALLRERVIANEAERFIVLVTNEKLVPKLGTRAPIPVEVVPFAVPTVTRRLGRLANTVTLRRSSGAPYRTDNGNAVIDLAVTPLDDARAFDRRVRAIAGVVDTGLFLGMADRVFVGEADGVRELASPSAIV